MIHQVLSLTVDIKVKGKKIDLNDSFFEFMWYIK